MRHRVNPQWLKIFIAFWRVENWTMAWENRNQTCRTFNMVWYLSPWLAPKAWICREWSHLKVYLISFKVLALLSSLLMNQVFAACIVDSDFWLSKFDKKLYLLIPFNWPYHTLCYWLWILWGMVTQSRCRGPVLMSFRNHLLCIRLLESMCRTSIILSFNHLD